MQPRIQNLLDDLGLKDIDEAIAEKLKLEQRLKNIPLKNERGRNKVLQDIDIID